MGCSHCLDSCEPQGRHMDMETFNKAIRLIKQLNGRFVVLSGGEPTDHPLFFEMLDLLVHHFGKEFIVVASNGMFLEDSKFTYNLQKRNVNVQITNDERYYPKKIKKILHKNFMYEHHISSLMPFGRAKNMPSINAMPSCFNLRSLSHNNFSLELSVPFLEARGKFCKPTINPDGSIVIGESKSCMSIGTVYDPIEVLSKNISDMRCNKCGLVSMLPASHRKTIKMP